MTSDDGFSLFEVIVVMLVLGILAAIALPSFAGKDETAMDAEAKSNVRNALAHVQSCYTEREDYTLCDEPSELDAKGVRWGTDAGQVEIRRADGATTKTQVTVRGYSTAMSGAQRHHFTFVKRSGEKDSRTCVTDGSGNDAGGCTAGTW